MCGYSDAGGRLALETGTTPTSEELIAATEKAPVPVPADAGSLDYLQHALNDLAGAREQAQQEVRAGIDSAVERIRDVREDLGSRAQGEADELLARLEHVSEEVRQEFGRAATRAQRTPEALTQMQAEIRNRKRKLTA